jgi:hypothetical protein
MKVTLIIAGILLFVWLIFSPRSAPPTEPTEPVLAAAPAEDDGITSPSDTPQQRQNQILICRQIVRSDSPKAAELKDSCTKLLARVDRRGDDK